MKIDSIGRKINPLAHKHKIKHGGWAAHRPTYQCWQDMKQRCYNPKHKQFPNYGGRGIVVCERWRMSFRYFLEDMGDKPRGMSLDRTDNDGNYAPDNCRWASPAQQRANQRRNVKIYFNGEALTVTDWARRLGRAPDTLRARIANGWPLEMVFSSDTYFCGNVPAPKAARKGAA